jgi:hypothetical protein
MDHQSGAAKTIIIKMLPDQKSKAHKKYLKLLGKIKIFFKMPPSGGMTGI